MSKVSIVVPCYNEESNLDNLYNSVKKVLSTELNDYDYEILILDNKSTDNSRNIIAKLCANDEKVKAIFHMYNCGSNANVFYGVQQSDGDCTIVLSADLQEPPSLIPMMVREWEKEHQNIIMMKTTSKENKFVYFLRSIYYKFFLKMSNIEQINQFSGFGCYDRSFVDVLRRINDNNPFWKGIVAEYATNRKIIEYEQQKRVAGKPSLNFWGYYDSAMTSFAIYAKWGLRLATFMGVLVAIAGFVIAIVYFILKIIHWNDFMAGNIPILLGTYIIGGCQLIFTGLIGEYLININGRVINRPMVIEEKRINF